MAVFLHIHRICAIVRFKINLHNIRNLVIASRSTNETKGIYVGSEKVAF